MALMTIYKGTITRVSNYGIWAVVPILATDFEFGPLETLKGVTYAVGDKVILGTLAAVSEDLVVLGKIGAGVELVGLQETIDASPLSVAPTWSTVYLADDGYWTYGPLPAESLPVHTHDDRYYTETETNTMLAGKAATVHVHSGADITSGTVAIARLPVAASGTSSTTQVVRADDSRLSDARTPIAHSHAIADLPVASDGEVSATKLVRANDSRLSATGGDVTDIKYNGLLVESTPVSVNYTGNGVSVNKVGADVSVTIPGTPTGAAGGSLSGTYPNPSLAAGAVNSAEINSAIKDAAAATASLRTLGTGAQQAAAGNDPRLSDARTPLAHSHAIADLPVATSGTSSATQVVRADDSRLSNARTPVAHTHAAADTTSGTFDIARIPVATSGTSNTTQVVRADDSRLSDARTPIAHTHTKAQITDFAHTHAIADLPVATSGTSSATQVVRADDSRLSNSRTPSGTAGGSLAGTYPNPSLAAGAVNSAEINSAIKDAAAATASLRTLGTGALQAAAGNHTHSLSGIVSGGTLAPPLVMTVQGASPSAAPAGSKSLYFKSDGYAYTMSETGVEKPLIPKPDQLHSNPGFDIAVASTVGPASTTTASRLVPENWSFYWNGGSVTKPPYASIVSDSAVTLYGSGNSVKITIPNEDHEQSLDTSVFAVVPGSLITFSVWIRGTGPGVYLSILTRDGALGDPDWFNAGTTNVDSPYTIPSTTWQKVTTSMVVPAGHTRCRVKIRASANSTGANSAANPGDIWYDESESSMAIAPPAQVIPGTMFEWPTATAPSGYLSCDGGTFSSDTYPTLAGVLGDTYGTHSGTTYYLPKKTAKLPDTGWITPTLLGSWAHFDARTFQYRRHNGKVRFRGIIKSGTGNICNLPPGFRPQARAGAEHHFPVDANGGFGEVRVWNSNGLVDLSVGSNVYVDMSSVEFFCEDVTPTITHIIKT